MATKDNRREAFNWRISTAAAFVHYCQDEDNTCFFSPNAMRFHGSRMCYAQGIKKTPNGLYFVMSNKMCFDDDSREYSLMWWSVENGVFYCALRSTDYYKVVKALDSVPTDKDFDTTKEV